MGWKWEGKRGRQTEGEDRVERLIVVIQHVAILFDRRAVVLTLRSHRPSLASRRYRLKLDKILSLQYVLARELPVLNADAEVGVRAPLTSSNSYRRVHI